MQYFIIMNIMNTVFMYNKQFQVMNYLRIRSNYFYYTPSLLTPSPSADFNESSSISTIWDSGFISNWSANVSYSSFYSVCAPTSCTYSVYGRQNIIIIVTSIIAVFSGGSTVLRLLTPVLIQVFNWFLNGIQGMQNIIL